MLYFISNQLEIYDKPYTIEHCLPLLKTIPVIGLDFETTGLDIRTLKPLLLALGDKHNKFVIDLLSISKQELQVLFIELQKNDILFVAHNFKYDLAILQYIYEIKLNWIWCTQIASQVIYNGCRFGHSLAELLDRHFDIKLSKQVRTSFINFTGNKFVPEQIEYAANDIGYLPDLYVRQIQIACKPDYNLMYLLREIEMPFIKVLLDMELGGVYINARKWKDAAIINKAKQDNIDTQIKQELNELANCYPHLFLERIKTKQKLRKKEINIHQAMLFDPIQITNTATIVKYFQASSSDNIMEIYKRFDIKLEDTKGDTLKQILPNTGILEPLTRLLIQYKELGQLCTTFGLAYLDHIHPITKRVHTNYSQCFTDTGRLSSSNPNLQNIPAIKELRNCVEADEGYEFVDIDLAGQELRLAASQSQDKLLLASFNEGLDLHSVLAQSSYRIITENNELIVSKKINKELRNNHKPVLFGLIYKAGTKRIAEVLNIPLNTAKLVLENIKALLPDLFKYQEHISKNVLKTNIIRANTITNRRKYFEDLVKGIIQEYKVEKEACNFPIQATAADQIKEAGIKLKELLDTYNDPKVRLIATIHDEYIVQIPIGNIDLANQCKLIMEECGSKYLTGLVMESEMLISKYWDK